MSEKGIRDNLYKCIENLVFQSVKSEIATYPEHPENDTLPTAYTVEYTEIDRNSYNFKFYMLEKVRCEIDIFDGCMDVNSDFELVWELPRKLFVQSVSNYVVFY